MILKSARAAVLLLQSIQKTAQNLYKFQHKRTYTKHARKRLVPFAKLPIKRFKELQHQLALADTTHPR
jgi:hypothetical protein